MRYRKNTSPRTITVKYDGRCHCCGAVIKRGELATYYPDLRAIAHAGGLEGNSARCASEIRDRAQYVRDPGEDAADRWNELNGDRY